MGITAYRDDLNNETNQHAKKRLGSAGIKRKWSSHFTTGLMHYVWIVVGILFVAFWGGCIIDYLEKFSWVKYTVDYTAVATPTMMITAAIIGAAEWSSTKHEEALDKFYDRLNSTNERLRAWKNARFFISKEWCQEGMFEKEMYACMEVDNLEYAIEKYRRGYLEPRDAIRALTCFTSRCQDGTFKETVWKIATRGGYRPSTLKALDKMCSVCRNDCPYRNAVPVI